MAEGEKSMGKKSEKVTASSLIGCEENPNNRMKMAWNGDMSYLFTILPKDNASRNRSMKFAIRDDVIRDNLDNIKRTEGSKGNKLLVKIPYNQVGKVDEYEKMITVIANGLGLLVWFTRPNDRLVTYKVNVNAVAA